MKRTKKIWICRLFGRLRQDLHRRQPPVGIHFPATDGMSHYHGWVPNPLTDQLRPSPEQASPATAERRHLFRDRPPMSAPRFTPPPPCCSRGSQVLQIFNWGWCDLDRTNGRRRRRPGRLRRWNHPFRAKIWNFRVFPWLNPTTFNLKLIS